MENKYSLFREYISLCEIINYIGKDQYISFDYISNEELLLFKVKMDAFIIVLTQNLLFPNITEDKSIEMYTMVIERNSKQKDLKGKDLQFLHLIQQLRVSPNFEADKNKIFPFILKYYEHQTKNEKCVLINRNTEKFDSKEKLLDNYHNVIISEINSIVSSLSLIKNNNDQSIVNTILDAVGSLSKLYTIMNIKSRTTKEMINEFVEDYYKTIKDYENKNNRLTNYSNNLNIKIMDLQMQINNMSRELSQMKIQNEASIKELEAKIQNLQGYVISKEKSNTKTKEDLQKTIKNKEDKIESLLLKGDIIQKREHLKKIIMYYLNQKEFHVLKMITIQ